MLFVLMELYVGYIHRNDGLNMILLPLHVTFLFIVKVIIYVDMMAKTQQIRDIFNYLENVIVERMCLNLMFKLTFRWF